MAKKVQVAIVGGGPVGVALGVDLATRGISAIVLEKRTGLQNIPKGQNLTQRTLESMQQSRAVEGEKPGGAGSRLATLLSGVQGTATRGATAAPEAGGPAMIGRLFVFDVKP